MSELQTLDFVALQIGRKGIELITNGPDTPVEL